MKSATFEFYMEWAKASITRTFEGKTWNEVGWELNAFQDIECLSRQIYEMGTADDMAALDALEAFYSALQSGRLNKRAFENLKAALSIGKIRCLSLSDGEAPARGAAAKRKPATKRRPAAKKTPAAKKKQKPSAKKTSTRKPK